MKDKIRIICLIVLFIILLVVINRIIKRESVGNVTQGTELSKEISIEVNSINFQKEVLNSDKKVIIDFYATWCVPCQMLSPVLEEVAVENSDIKLVKIDVDQNEELAYKYGISAMPTIIVMENGEEINRSIGVISKEDILKLLKK